MVLLGKHRQQRTVANKLNNEAILHRVRHKIMKIATVIREMLGFLYSDMYVY